MYAKRLNKVYPINTAQEKKDYLARGYDICDDDGNVIAYNPAKTVPYSEYVKVVQENEQLRAQLGVDAAGGNGNMSDPLDNMSVEDLKKYAKDNGVDIGGATSQKGILKKIREALPTEPANEENPPPNTLKPIDDGSPKMGMGSSGQV